MKKRTKLALPSLLLAGLTLAACVASAQSQGAFIPVLPESSLAKWYKPVNDRQVWLHTMFSLRRELQAVEHYAEQRDQTLLAKWTGRLADHYREIGDMVPEWKEELEPEILTDLEVAVAAGDFPAAGQAARRLEHNCDGCHSDYRALAAARFRAPDFSTLRVDDGQGGSRDHDEHMELMSTTLNEIKIASEDDRWDAAKEAETRLRSQLLQLGTSCESCHRDEAPRERILGAEPQAGLDALKQALEAKSVKDAGRYLGETAVNVCARCHGVHRTLYDLRTVVLP